VAITEYWRNDKGARKMSKDYGDIALEYLDNYCNDMANMPCPFYPEKCDSVPKNCLWIFLYMKTKSNKQKEVTNDKDIMPKQ
jgi:hypothetical protein